MRTHPEARRVWTHHIRIACLAIGGVLLFAAGWGGGLLGSNWFRGRLTMENASAFRGLAEAIVEQQRRSGFGPEKP